VFEYESVGKLAGAEPGHDLLLPSERPLSYLRAGQRAEDWRGLTQALLERRATELRVRVPVVVPRGGAAGIVTALRRFAVSQVFPVIDGTREREGEVDLCWLDLTQVAALRRQEGTGLAERGTAVVAAGIRFSPTYEVSPQPQKATRFWQYWNSHWEFVDPPEGSEGWWRVRPNETRRRGHWLLLDGRGPEARGTFAACLHPQMWERLGKPPYVVVEHPFRGGQMPVLVLEDKLEELTEPDWRDTIFLDRTARDALGLLDGEFCVVHPWLRPRGTLFYRRLRDRMVGARTIAAHTRAPARADLEKPVCRIEPEALQTIGAREGEFVQIERVRRPQGAATGHWEVVRTSRRALPIDSAERARRADWEAPQSWDERSEGPEEGGAGVPELTGYVDCAERLGLFPPYPAIYLNYYTRKEALQGLGLCEPVQVRVGFWSRIAAEASEFVWLALIALLGAAAAFPDSSPWQLVAVVALVALTTFLVCFRAIRAIR
jgi:hypothetical protein